MSEKKWTSKCIKHIIELKIQTKQIDDLQSDVKDFLRYINSMAKADKDATIDAIFYAVREINNLPKQKGVIFSFIKDI